MRCAVCRVRQLRHFCISCSSISVCPYMHGPAGYAWDSDRDGFLIVLGTSSGQAVSFFFWFHCFSLRWVDARRLIHFTFSPSSGKHPLVYLSASSMRHFSAPDSACFVFYYRNTPESFRVSFFSLDSSSSSRVDVSISDFKNTPFLVCPSH